MRVTQRPTASPAIPEQSTTRTTIVPLKTVRGSVIEARGSVLGMEAAAARPFRVLGIQQIALGALDKTPLRTLWVDLLGAAPKGNYRSERENVDEDIAEIGAGLGVCEIDLMMPLDPDKRPRVADPALNHVGLWVDDLHAAVGWLGQRGVRFTPGGVRKGASGFDVCFIHPKGNDATPQGGCGVLIELVQAPPAVIDAFTAASR